MVGPRRPTVKAVVDSRWNYKGTETRRNLGEFAIRPSINERWRHDKENRANRSHLKTAVPHPAIRDCQHLPPLKTVCSVSFEPAQILLRELGDPRYTEVLHGLEKVEV